jgi:hypothetical protein
MSLAYIENQDRGILEVVKIRFASVEKTAAGGTASVHLVPQTTHFIGICVKECD